MFIEVTRRQERAYRLAKRVTQAADTTEWVLTKVTLVEPLLRTVSKQLRKYAGTN